MAHARRIHPIPVPSRDSAARLTDRRIGGMAVVEYLYELFAASPLELFSRISVLAVLDHVKKDRDLFPDGQRELPFSPSMTGLVGGYRDKVGRAPRGSRNLPL